ncbi:hypothetical protein GCM10027028_33050 [Streptomyces sundarbansensis]
MGKFLPVLMSRRFGLRTVVLLHPPGCRPSMETAGRGLVGWIAGRACGPIPGVASRAALPGYRPDHTAATIDEPMAATQATYAICRARSLIAPRLDREPAVREEEAGPSPQAP